METGVVSTENISEILRNISQKRKQGILVLSFADRKVEVHFIQGKVVEVIDSTQDPLINLLQRLKSGGLVKDDFDAKATNYTELFESLARDSYSSSKIDKNKFKWAIRQTILDYLYSLNIGNGAYYSFEVQMVEASRDFAPNISVGQLLLDLVALEGDRERFNSIFLADQIVIRSETEDLALSEDEHLICNCIGTGCQVGALRAKTMLSTYHFQDALLSMFERGLLQLQSKTKTSVNPEILSDFDNAIDSAFDQAFEDSAQQKLNQLALDTTVELPAQALQHQVAQSKKRDSHLNRANQQLLQSNGVVHALLFAFLLCSVLLPFVFWNRMFAGF